MAVVTITKGSIPTLAARHDVASAFPFLAAYAMKKSSGCCSSAKGPILDGNVAIRAILNLPAERRNALKQLLGAETLRLVVIQSGRSKVEVI